MGLFVQVGDKTPPIQKLADHSFHRSVHDELHLLVELNQEVFTMWRYLFVVL